MAKYKRGIGLVDKQWVVFVQTIDPLVAVIGNLMIHCYAECVAF